MHVAGPRGHASVLQRQRLWSNRLWGCGGGRTLSAEPTVERYEDAAREDWDRLVLAARGRHFMFQRAYMDYHADRFSDASLMILRSGRPCALFPATRHGETIISHGGLT